MSECHACEREGLDCVRYFTCHVCHEHKRACTCLVGGFEAVEQICTLCHFRRATGRDLVSKYTNKYVRRMQEAM